MEGFLGENNMMYFDALGAEYKAFRRMQSLPRQSLVCPPSKLTAAVQGSEIQPRVLSLRSSSFSRARTTNQLRVSPQDPSIAPPHPLHQLLPSILSVPDHIGLTNHHKLYLMRSLRHPRRSSWVSYGLRFSSLGPCCIS